MMVAFYGFNKKVGNISFYDSSGQRDATFQKPYSEETGKLIDEEVRKMVRDAYEQTMEILLKNKEALHKVADFLLKQEVVYKSELDVVLGERIFEKVTVVNPEEKSSATNS
jgi:AFG3 family protein